MDNRIIGAIFLSILVLLWLVVVGADILKERKRRRLDRLYRRRQQ